MKTGRRGSLTALAACLALLATACTHTAAPTDTGPPPDAAVADFAAAWQGLKPDAVARLTSDPASAAQEVGSVLKNLAPSKLVVTAAKPQQSDSTSATASAAYLWTLAGGITWKYTSNWKLGRASAGDPWKIQWTTDVINPRLSESQTLALRTTDATDGTVLDRSNQQILSPTTVYSVVALPGKVGNIAATAASLADILGTIDPTVTAESVIAGLKSSKASAGYTVTNLREVDYQKVRARLDSLSGISVPLSTRNLPPIKDFAKFALSEAEPVAQKLAMGTPGWEIDSIDATGAELETLASGPAKPGKNVVLTLDTAVEKAAEEALRRIPEPAAIVAIQPSTGEILAVAQNAAANQQGPLALMGEYPPGSTFKIVTATASFDAKLVTPTTSVECPGQVVIDHRAIHNNASFDLGTVSVTTAFAESCNTTFAKLATRMPGDALTKAASQYGIGRDFVIPGLTTLTGKVPAADSTVQKAENGFGQGVVLMTPFAGALMAATAANGRMPTPTFIRGTNTTIDQPVVPRTASTTSAIRSLMRAVVTDGTGKVLQDAGTVYAKTGTADFIDAKGADHAHAWTVGFRGDLAFSILIVAGNSSRRTTAIADAFLKSVPAN